MVSIAALLGAACADRGGVAAVCARQSAVGEAGAT
ncbi:ORFL149C.iORF1 [Human betaherpesvirus 5]|nr:ORFL149C.iORF1 [Human betaherpesvirus 5]QHX40479.1 ORFL149C.iORF1 [Human betaherpesvirus 5]